MTLHGQRTKISVSVLIRSPRRGQIRASDPWSWIAKWPGVIQKNVTYSLPLSHFSWKSQGLNQGADFRIRTYPGHYSHFHRGSRRRSHMSQDNRNHPVFVSVAPPILSTCSDQSGLDFSACLRWGSTKAGISTLPGLCDGGPRGTHTQPDAHFPMCMASSPCVIIQVRCMGRLVHGCI